MDENEAVAEQQLATPIFNVYRRGYDPEQVEPVRGRPAAAARRRA